MGEQGREAVGTIAPYGPTQGYQHLIEGVPRP